MFAYYAGHLRRQLEMGLFPPDAGDEVSRNMQRYEFELAEVFNKLALRRPDITGRVMTRYEAWVPTVVPEFKPGWRCSRPADPKDVWPVIATLRARQSAYLRGMITLLKDPVYTAACTRILQSGDSGGDPGTKYDMAADMQTMLQIERRMQVEGLATQNSRAGT